MPPEFGDRLARLFADDSLFHASFWHGLIALVSPLLWPFLVGSSLGAMVLSLVAYRIALAFVNARRKHMLGWVHRAHGPEERDERRTG
jgi:hypothetical protein